ncbi:MAG: L-threonylcarbamoyladenylate synthase [Chthoniobacterales bacterium]
MQTTVLDAADARAIAQAVAVLRSGEVVALPTETVYGLAGDALNPLAVARIFEAKNRPHFDPLIVHVADFAMLETVAIADDPLVARLAEKYWPGPLTILLPKRAIISDLVTAGSPFVAVRMPAHPVFRAVLQSYGSPIAAPSANPFGQISPTEARHVLDGLGGRIPLLLDSGNCQHGLESTIVYPENGTLHILRDGPIPMEELAAFGPIQHQRNAAAPGQIASHYAPRKPLILVDSAADVQDATGNGFLGFQSSSIGFSASEVLSPSGNLVEAAANLFAALHRLDAAPIQTIYAEIIPELGLGRAIMDRLKRASAKR